MNHIDTLVHYGLAERMDGHLIVEGYWRQLILASTEMRERDQGMSKIAAYSDIMDACSYIKLTVTARKPRQWCYALNLFTVQVDDGEVAYEGEVALPHHVTLAEAKTILED